MLFYSHCEERHGKAHAQIPKISYDTEFEKAAMDRTKRAREEPRDFFILCASSLSPLLFEFLT